MLQPDDTVCFCFHVSLRKVQNFCRIEKPKAPSQISQCLSAGTGCGWCVRMLERVHAEICGPYRPAWQQQPSRPDPANLPQDAQSYAAGRQQYLRQRAVRPNEP